MKTTFKAVLEARRSHLTYTEKKVKGEIDKVITELKGSESGQATLLAKRLHNLNVALKKMDEKRKEYNEKLTAEVEDLFDQSTDIVYTRIVKTASFIIQVAKQEQVKEKAEVDYESIYKELANMVPAHLLPAIDQLFDTYTRKWMPDPKKPSLRVSPIEEASAASGVLMTFLEKVITSAKGLLKRMKSWGESYDAELKDLHKKFNHLKS